MIGVAGNIQDRRDRRCKEDLPACRGDPVREVGLEEGRVSVDGQNAELRAEGCAARPHKEALPFALDGEDLAELVDLGTALSENRFGEPHRVNHGVVRLSQRCHEAPIQRIARLVLGPEAVFLHHLGRSIQFLGLGL